MDKKHAEKILSLLTKNYDSNKTALNYSTPLELLIATILSAQCTDKRVNIVTEKLFKKYKTLSDYADADLKEFELDIKSTGFYKNKARNIINSARLIQKEFNGKVPDTMEKLTRLPGVARKTANIVLFHFFGKNEGIAVDTHVKRLSFRLGLTKNIDPQKIEQDLMKIFPREKWGILSNLLIEHGRTLCAARKPLCAKCWFNNICPKKGI
ncbi:endonuclease III [Candidatus Omnitrophus magneticus]|uniref:Endonuclease III n=1 Tax=Candidatus Omnitrophus magneticus TaxID=1609969 RepID=A0A0F0CMJ5_9BACT|nr:endonuclease III [Candidatus Omnitrophus magneticus]